MNYKYYILGGKQMNKKEVLEIKKIFTPANCCITRIAGCYVDAEKEKRMENVSQFLTLPEEEAFKYFTIFKNALSGKLGKGLLNTPIALKEEESGGAQNFMLKLRNSKLNDTNLVEEFFDKIIENYWTTENYYIILTHCMYDVPGKTSDNLSMEDASEEVFEFLLCSICPVSLSKEGLSYDTENNRFQNRIRDWIVDKPAHAFMFPAFNDRSTDIHEALFFSKKADDVQIDMIEKVLGAEIPLTEDVQKKAYQYIMQNVFGDDLTLEKQQAVDIELLALFEENENPSIGEPELKKILENSGADDTKMERYEDIYQTAVGKSHEMQVSNMIDNKSTVIKLANATIKVDADRMDIVSSRKIDGRNYVLIEADSSVEMNGIEVKL